MKKKVLIIGLDSADYYLIKKWIGEGYLPVLSSLLKNGSHGKLDSSADVGSGTVWPTLFTGTSPAKHNSIGSRRMIGGSYKIMGKKNLIQRKPFWLHLKNKKIALIDIPRFGPSKINGIQLVAWGAHSPGWTPASYPKELIKEVKTKFGKYPVPDCDEFIPKGLTQLKKFFDDLVLGIKKKGELTRYYLNLDNWDLFITVFAETHCVGHNYFHLMDKDHPLFDNELAEHLGDSVFKVYSLIDSEISKIIESNGNFTCLIISPEGMGPNFTGTHLLPEILRRLGMSAKSIDEKDQQNKTSAINGLRKYMPSVLWGPHAVRNLKSKMPESFVKGIEFGKKIVPKETWHKMKCYLMNLGNDWQYSRAFCFPSDFNGAIRINLKGREPNGLVNPEEYETFCGSLASDLQQLINAETGSKAISEILFVHKIHKGEFLDQLPDLVLKWAGNEPIRKVYSPKIGTVSGENFHERSGAHRPYGFFIASGDQIAKGKSIDNGTIMDIPPTIFNIMDEPIPEEMDGKVLSGIFN
ncbi:MAG: alkaline phosphatase family protein [Ignavibacteria bacterium]|nr:alkaline phosphatase family protein [Ignavibacteria bacterium]